ncbi:DNA (cytosine-5-)-methyltransferase N-terminal subunit [Mycoplasmopsis columbina]|uniref:DNA (cytosine-5-)-methyltransferase N-terminal subunit n=1 Tax=Mycoplasmopsis columbina TaxID=114881 RepID=UPI0006925953|nr:hypothetical protein [Mycoplasmopsis columbina]
MKKTINFFEMFAGIGAQHKAFKNLENKLKIKTNSLGTCDFYIDAIVAYMLMHHGTLERETEFSVEQMISLLNKQNFSSNSKNVISKNYFKRMHENKLRKIFPYLFAYVNNDYFYQKYSLKNKLRERERESKRNRYT